MLTDALATSKHQHEIIMRQAIKLEGERDALLEIVKLMIQVK